MKINFSEIEKKWQAYWSAHQTFRTQDEATQNLAKPKYYVLDMFPYPSGSGLHAGHIEGYTATDVIARFKRHKGFNVLHPMGWDAFGLPAEQYAIKTGTHPRLTTQVNVSNFKDTLNRLGFSYDWQREINTTDAGYVKWTQWIFLKLYEQGLAYVAQVPVNWCEEQKVVLANEEVDEYLRKGFTVVRRPLRQWVLRITAYADRLLEDLELLDWTESIKEMQRNWIGKSIGCEIDFSIANSPEKVKIFTTRPDTIFGATYLVLSPEHPLIQALTTSEQRTAVERYQETAKKKSDLERTGLQKEKTGVFTGNYAVNPATNQKIPVWVSDFVLMGYGTGAIMSVPAHDERDWEFAKKFELPIVEVIRSTDAGVMSASNVQEKVFEAKSGVCVNSTGAELSLDGLGYEAAVEKVSAWIESSGRGKRKVNYKLRDWVFSRQRYWGEPIPIKHYEDGSMMPETNLPLLLPEVEKYEPSNTGESPLANISEWLYGEDADGRKFKRETNTMPQWAGSCWYYLRFIDPKNAEAFVSAEKEKYWMNVDLYIGGAEHAVLHLLYARFWHKVLYDLKLVGTKEPFQRLFNQGMILGADGEKMSKSRGNIVDVNSLLTEYGADVPRLYVLFLGPLEQTKPWNTHGIEGINRFLGKVWRLVYAELAEARYGQDNGQENGEGKERGAALVDDAPMPDALQKAMHKTIKKVGEDTENLRFNTAISAMMIFVNDLVRENCHSRVALENLMVMLSPYAPHLAEELWEAMGHRESIAAAPFPEFDARLVADDTVTIAVQVNGKLRGSFEASVDAAEETLVETASAIEGVKKFMDGKVLVKKIVVPKKLVSFVVKEM